MKRLLSYFIKGLIVIAPVGITLYLLYQIGFLMDGIFSEILIMLGVYFPGLGILLSIVAVILVGMLSENWLTGKFFKVMDSVFGRVPLVKTIYTTIKDVISSVSDGKKGFSKLAIIEIPDFGGKLFGFVTCEKLPDEFDLDDYVVVYLMQSMQWAGNIAAFPKEWVRVIDIPSEQALKFVASAGLIGGVNGKNKFDKGQIKNSKMV